MFLALSMDVPTGLAALLHQSQVFMTVLLVAIMFKEAVLRHRLIAMIAAAVGLALIGVGQYQGNSPLVGLWVLLAASFCWAVGNIVVKKLGAVNPLSVVWGNILAFECFCCRFIVVIWHRWFECKGLESDLGRLGECAVSGLCRQPIGVCRLGLPTL